MSHFHVIDSEHVPSAEQESYAELSSRIELLCQSRSEYHSAQADRLNVHMLLSSQMRRLEDDIIIQLADKVDRVNNSLTVDNASQHLTDIQVFTSGVVC